MLMSEDSAQSIQGEDDPWRRLPTIRLLLMSIPPPCHNFCIIFVEQVSPQGVSGLLDKHRGQRVTYSEYIPDPSRIKATV